MKFLTPSPVLRVFMQRYTATSQGSATSVNDLIVVLTRLAAYGLGDCPVNIFDPNSGEYEALTGLTYGDGPDSLVKLYSDDP